MNWSADFEKAGGARKKSKTAPCLGSLAHHPFSDPYMSIGLKEMRKLKTTVGGPKRQLAREKLSRCPTAEVLGMCHFLRGSLFVPSLSVPAQGGRIGVGDPAVPALEGLFSRVRAHVLDAAALASKAHPTLAAPEGPLVAVGHHVDTQVPSRAAGLGTDAAHVRLQAGVAVHVLVQIILLREGRSALRAQVGSFTRVHPAVA